MKKILLLSLGALLGLSVSARDFTYEYEGQTLTYTVVDEEAKICETKKGYEKFDMSTGFLFIPGNNISGNLIIPPFAKDGDVEYTVTGMSQMAFAGCSELTSVTIPNSVLSIELAAFSGCSKLTSVEIPNSVNYLGNEVFWRCSGLTSLVIPNSVTTRCSATFQDCSNLKSVTISNSMNFIGECAFFNCSSLTEAILPPSVIVILNSAFEKCNNLSSIIMGHQVARIDQHTFDYCPITSVYITAQEPPTTEYSPFSNYEGTLYVQGEAAAEKYKAAEWWSNFNRIKVMVEAETIEMDTTPISGEVGETFQLSAKVMPENATLPYVFWRSTNTAIATVDYNGLVTIVSNGSRVAPVAEGETGVDVNSCDIIAETLYADGPVARVSVTASGAGVEEVDTDTSAGDIDYTAPYEVYNFEGIQMGGTLSELRPGIYIVRQGLNVKKVAVK